MSQDAVVVKPSVKSDNPFGAWASAGFGTELLPIIPPQGELSPRSNLDPSDRGKTPGLRNSSGKWAGFPQWADHQSGAGDVTKWDKLHTQHGAGVGLQGRLFPAVDVDVLDAQVSADIVVLADALLGAAPERVGRPPKALLVYALEGGADPITKRRVEFFLPGDPNTKHAVEVLGKGQQYVVQGTHPGTGNPYTWTGGKSPVQLGAAGLTQVTGDKVDRFLDEVVRLVEGLGGTIHQRAQHTNDGSRANVDQGGLAGEPERIREALEAMGNAIAAYDEWITMCAAIKAALRLLTKPSHDCGGFDSMGACSRSLPRSRRNWRW